MTLYELSREYIEALDALEIDEETGEVTGFDAITNIEDDIASKAENIACYIKGLLAESSAVKEEEKKLKKRREALETKSDRLKTYAMVCMANVGMKNIKGARAELYIRKAPSVESDDKFIEWATNNEHYSLIRHKESFEPDKREIKAWIESGKAIEGAKIIECESLIIK